MAGADLAGAGNSGGLSAVIFDARADGAIGSAPKPGRAYGGDNLINK
jgi:hypothetical protein